MFNAVKKITGDFTFFVNRLGHCVYNAGVNMHQGPWVDVIMAALNKKPTMSASDWSPRSFDILSIK